MRFNTGLLLACLLLNCESITAFVPLSIRQIKIPSTTSLGPRLEYLEQKTPDDETVERLLSSYSEKSRIYRRNVFTAADWVASRKPNRYQEYLTLTFQSGLVQQLRDELSAIIFTCSFVILYNDVFALGYTDFAGVQHEGLLPSLPPLELPIIAWSLSSGALGLLLTFRSNSAYGRWNEARTAWGKVINDSRSIARMACIWSKSYKRIDDASLQRLGEAVCSFSRSLMNRTLPPQEDEANFIMYTYKKIKDQNYAKVLRTAKHRPTAALAEITSILVDFQLNPLHQVEVELCTTGLCDALGASERIFTSPIPTFYTRHTARFVAFWLFTLPLGLYEPLKGTWNHWAVIPMTLIIASLFLGIDELATQMEEPFSILPMEKMCEGAIRTSVMEQVERSQKGIQSAYVGEESHLIDASPDNIRTFAVDLPHFVNDQVVHGDGITPQRYLPIEESSTSLNFNGDANGLSPNGESQPPKEEKADPKMKPAPTFEEYMKSRNL